MKLGALLLLAGLALVSATCPNLCNQHGTCGENDRCTCFSNWQGADCSERVCSYGLAWVDAPSATNEAHAYAECSNKGVCNRETGECECYAGYEGKGCRRASCPNDCSGHGTCYFLEQLKDLNGKMIVDYGTPSTARADKKWYDLWDKSKIQGCVCDPYYEGTDCSLRQCPRGDNRLTVGQVTGGMVDPKDQGNTHQEILITQGVAADANSMTGEFTLTFTDLYGGVWETEPIQLHYPNFASEGGNPDNWSGGNAAYIATRIKAELENLPNQVVESVTVTSLACGRGLAITASDGTIAASETSCTTTVPADTTNNLCHTVSDVELPNGRVAGSYLGFSSTFQAAAGSINYDIGTNGGATATTGDYVVPGQCLNFMVEFTGHQNSGVQELLQVNYKGCNYDGCAPQYLGITDPDIDGTANNRLFVHVEDVTTFVASGSSNQLIHKEAAICSEHGLCDSTTGLCQCFSGYYDEDCNQQTVLV